MNILGNVQALFQSITTLASVATTLNLPGDHDRYSLTGSQSFSKLIGDPQRTDGRIVILQGASGCTATAVHTKNPTVAGQMDLRTGDHTFTQGDILVLQGQSNGTWRKLISSFVTAGNSGLLRAPQVLTSGTSYTTPADCNRIRVRVLGGGGGGGGCDTAASNGGAGGGGGAGGYAEKYYAVTPGTAYTYAIGAAGAAGANTGGAGGSGGNTTFTDGVTLVTANGGSGGAGMANGTTAISAAGGAGGVVSTNGDLNGTGAPGERGHRISGTVGASGMGGSTAFGGGGLGIVATGGAGNVGSGYGAGGGGALVVNNSTAAIGGAGAAGVLIIEELS